ncbi:SCO6745 family protein [Gordonia sp. CPCC 205333]|uniref:SCO6745 family protein n=1 Tax=Gordonia sp. CPCC 205333 TaxID=3140790 RepID=UPI003AF37D57
MTSPDAGPQTPADVARRAYETLEPYHVLAYFNPGLGDAQRDTGLDAHSFYVGARGGVLGECSPSVVAATFYNFAPQMISTSWAAAREVGLPRVMERREQMLDRQYREILGGLIEDAELTDLISWYGATVSELPLTGRPLAAAWAATSVPDAPHLALWRHLSVLREWRGDHHIAALVLYDVNGIDAGVLHEAELPDPTVTRRALGHKFFLISRGWTEDDWQASIDRLADRGLLTRTETGHRLTDSGFELYQAIERRTDDATGAAWSAPEAGEILSRTRPYVKAVIKAGVLPGTRKKEAAAR